MSTATNTEDNIYVSRYYNWHGGSFKDGYTYAAFYTLKPDAPEDAVETLSKNLIVPLLEKLFADGTLHEYEVDTQAVHTEAPGTFVIVYMRLARTGWTRSTQRCGKPSGPNRWMERRLIRWWPSRRTTMN